MKIQIINWWAMIKCFIILLFFTISPIIRANSFQNDTSLLKKNTVYLDFSSKGAYYSINYDRVFFQKKVNLSYWLGFTILAEAVAMQIGTNLFFGKQNSHAEVSLTVMPYIDKYQSMWTDNDLSDKYIYIIPGFGYRYQKPTGGIFFKASVSPMVVLDPPSDDFWKMDPKLFFAANLGIGLNF